MQPHTTTRLLTALLCLICAATSHAAGTTKSRAPLEEFLRSYVTQQDPQPDKKTRYLAADVRLAAGPQDQTLVYLIGADYCGSGACLMLVLDQAGDTYRIVTESSPVRLPVRALSSRHKGWRDLSVAVGGGGIVHGYRAALRFDGKTYPDNPTLGRAKVSPQDGTEVLSDQDAGTPLFP